MLQDLDSQEQDYHLTSHRRACDSDDSVNTRGSRPPVILGFKSCWKHAVCGFVMTDCAGTFCLCHSCNVEGSQGADFQILVVGSQNIVPPVMSSSPSSTRFHRTTTPRNNYSSLGEACHEPTLSNSRVTSVIEPASWNITFRGTPITNLSQSSATVNEKSGNNHDDETVSTHQRVATVPSSCEVLRPGRLAKTNPSCHAGSHSF
jgi:hypothetical protein